MFGQLEIWKQSLCHVLYQNKFQIIKTFILKELSNERARRKYQYLKK